MTATSRSTSRTAIQVDFDAELEDQTLDVDIDIEGPAADGSYTYPLGDAGTVTIDVAGMDVPSRGRRWMMAGK